MKISKILAISTICTNVVKWFVVVALFFKLRLTKITFPFFSCVYVLKIENECE